MNEFKTCDECSGFDSNKLVKKLKEIDESADIKIGCQNMCAIGAKRPFVIVNGILFVEETIEKLIEKIKEEI